MNIQSNLFKQSIDERFARFDSDNPAVYNQFKALACRMKATGRNRYSARTIFHIIRWHRDLLTKDDNGFKINDHYSSRYVRKLLDEMPGFIGFFELRELKSQ